MSCWCFFVAGAIYGYARVSEVELIANVVIAVKLVTQCFEDGRDEFLAYRGFVQGWVRHAACWIAYSLSEALSLPIRVTTSFMV